MAKQKSLSAPPKFMEPQLAQLVSEPPAGDGWVHEIKFDGYRTLTRIDEKSVHFFTRSGLDWTAKYSSLSATCRKVKAKNAVLDGEIVWLDENGRSRFQNLQNALKEGLGKELVYYVFDLLFLDGKDLRDEPLEKRKKLLKKILPKGKTSRVRYSDHWTSNAREMFAASCGNGLEGIVSKRLDAPYGAGRGSSWVKTKCLHEDEFVIGGYSAPKGARVGFGALLCGLYDPKTKKLKYTGRVGTGFDNNGLDDLLKQLKKLKTEVSPFGDTAPNARDVTFVKPKLVAQIGYSERTSEGILRHPVFHGLREDKPVRDVIDRPARKPPQSTKAAKAVKAAKKSKSDATEAHFTHPDRIIFKNKKITKLDVAKFYTSIQDRIFPHLESRPLSLLRCPQGANGTCFFQKHLEPAQQHDLHSELIHAASKDEDIEIITVTSGQGLVELVQANSFEIHTWGSRVANIDRPTQLIFDLDPAPDVSWKTVRDAGFEVRDLLAELELESYVKVSGGKGLHIQVPIAPRYDWTQAKAFTKAVAELMSKQSPTKYTSNISKAKRGGRIFIDYLRNGFGATAVCAYSLRARDSAAIALPVTWKELKTVSAPDQYTIEEADLIFKKRKEPWVGYFENRQKIKWLEKR